jgi:hypothetical protein
MMKQLTVVGALCAALCLPSLSAHAVLVDRGGGMLYDTVLNITWLQDANYAKTSGYCDAYANCSGLTDGRMSWTQANTWASSLEYGGHSDWRLARSSPVNGTVSGWNYTRSSNGSTDFSPNINSRFSELAFMFYVNLGLTGEENLDGTPRSDAGVNGNGVAGGQKDVGIVKNLQNYAYWSGSAYPPLYPPDHAWSLFTYNGFQMLTWKNGNHLYAWAVHDGDIAAVPVPGSVALLAGGLALLGVVTRRRERLAVEK